jgi:tripartite-type tricarboxylate transporter receptor subunit TctC
MDFSRRLFLTLAAGAAALSASSRITKAQAYPSRPVRLIVGLAAGGGQDIVARLMGQWLSDRLGRQFIIENRPGASGNLALEAAANAAPDGYTLALLGVNNAINASLYNKAGFEFLRDIAPVAGVMRVPLVMVVHPTFPATTVPEFIAYAKANPAKINMGSGGNGTSIHVSGELFKLMTGVEMLHVPYQGAGPAINDLVAGHVQVYFGPIAPSIQHIRAGNLRALAVTTKRRSPSLPDIPSMDDFIPGYDVSGWQGLVAPKGTPVTIIEKLNAEVNAALTDPQLKTRLLDLGATPLPGSPEDFAALIATDTEIWARVVKAIAIRAN